MRIKFVSQIRKGNKRGTGFLYIPKDKIDLFNLGDWVRIRLLDNIYFFSKIIFYSHKLGIYVPRYIVIKNDLLNKWVEIRIEKVDGFYAKMYSDGKIYIPKDIIESQKLKRNDIVLVKGIERGKIIGKKYSKIHLTVRKQRKQNEYTCVFDKNRHGKELIFQIENQQQKFHSIELNPIVNKILVNFHFALTDKDSAIIFKGNKIPAMVSTQFQYSNLAFYLGAYFADGTKKGNSWAICASTFEQARYYLKMHNFLIKDSRPEFTISYTNIYNIEPVELKKNLVEIWQKEIDIKVNKFRIRKPSGKSISKWNKYGTLVIREHSQILLDFYNALLKLLVKEIFSKEDKKLALDFICGVMEGDGCASATKRGHMIIFTNKEDICILENILKITHIKFKVTKEEENKYSLRIGALEILRNFHLLKKKIFILYPKRRKALFERLKTVGAIKFLIGNHGSTNWVKAWFRNNGFCDENYKITKNGLRLSNILLNEMERVEVK